MSSRRPGQLTMLLRLLTKLTLSGSFVLASIGSSACSASNTQPATSPDNPVAAQTPQPEYLTDPTCCGLMTVGNQGVDLAWHTLTREGRYRLARKDDFKPPARAFGADDPLNSIFAYCWGRLGYDPDPDHWYHLAAIVVDTHRTDVARFGLVIFSAPKNGTYQPYWLYRGRDLSRTVVWAGSGDLMLAEYRDDGSRDALFVEWDRRRKRYVATALRPKPT